jgi:tRNA (cytidine/uridine-2'-O-)-methyltransferase
VVQYTSRLITLRESFVFHIVLFQPEIPPNTGNVIRLSANAGAHLHLIEPLGFDISEKSLRRAGLDYHKLTHMQVWPSLEACFESVKPARWFALSTRGAQRYDQVSYQPGDMFVFGPETRGLPQELLDTLPHEQRLRIPMLPDNRSLNLSNSVAVLIYEAWRQQGFVEGA